MKIETMLSKWPKIFPELSAEQKEISNDFMKYWHGVLSLTWSYRPIENFNHGYVVKHSKKLDFKTSLEIGAGLGEHLHYESLSPVQTDHYHALELRQNMLDALHKNHPSIKATLGDCQEHLPFDDGYFDRIIAIHVLEHLKNLPAALKELHRVCHKSKGRFFVVIPCEGGFIYSIARKISAQRIFEKRYKQSYRWFIEREHVNVPKEIIEELEVYFDIVHRDYFPFKIPLVDLNLCLGLTLRPKEK